MTRAEKVEFFETVLEANAKYVNAIKQNADAKEQVRLLSICKDLMEVYILGEGLATEYKEYCEITK